MATGADWVAVRSITGGWKVSCRLCGKHIVRTFMAARTSWAEASHGAEQYAETHRRTAAHEAALAAFHDLATVEPSQQDLMLNRVFDTPLPTTTELRLQKARAAAHAASLADRQEKREANRRAKGSGSADAARPPQAARL